MKKKSLTFSPNHWFVENALWCSQRWKIFSASSSLSHFTRINVRISCTNHSHQWIRFWLAFVWYAQRTFWPDHQNRIAQQIFCLEIMSRIQYKWWAINNQIVSQQIKQVLGRFWIHQFIVMLAVIYCVRNSAHYKKGTANENGVNMRWKIGDDVIWAKRNCVRCGGRWCVRLLKIVRALYDLCAIIYSIGSHQIGNRRTIKTSLFYLNRVWSPQLCSPACHNIATDGLNKFVSN